MTLEEIDLTPVQADNMLMDHIQDWFALTFTQIPPKEREEVKSRFDERRIELIKLITKGLEE